MTSTRDYRIGLVLVTTSAVAWSTAGFFTRLIPVDAWTMLSWRGLFGAFSILAFIILFQRGQIFRGFARMGWPGWSYAVISAVGMVMYISALKLTTVAHVAIIYATVPFLAAGIAWLVLREVPSRGAIIASAAALGGVAVMVGVDAGTGPGGLIGDALALGMTLTLAVMMVMARRYPDLPLLPAAGLSSLLSAALAVPFGSALTVSAGDIALLAMFGLVNSAVGLSLFTLGSRLLPAVETALIGSLDAPLAPIWVWLAFGETPSAATLAGGAIVFGAVMAHIIREARGGRASKPGNTLASRSAAKTKNAT